MEKEKINRILRDIKRGKPVVVVDEYTREFEGDLVLAAEMANFHNLVFCMRHAKGLMCIPCNRNRLEELEIPIMVKNTTDPLETPFTVSVDSMDGHTGMSVEDRLKTISVFLDPSAKPEQLCRPGHLFPLRPRENLLLDRRGHTETSIELMKLADLKEVAIIIEIMGENGEMIKGKNLEDYCKIYDLELISVPEVYEAVYNKSL